jgi:UTP--glucose-1-phosphate uridylyltransferase
LIITGRGKRAIEDHFDRSVELEETLDSNGKEELKSMIENIADLVDIHYIRQKEALGLGHAILRAEKHVGSEPFTVLLGDDIVFSKKPCTKQLLELYGKYDAPIIAVEEVPKNMVSSYGIIDGKAESEGLYKIEHLVEKPKPADAPSNLGIIGRYLLTSDIFEHLERTEKGAGGEIQLTDGLRSLNESATMYAWEFEGVRYDLGNKFEYLKASIEYGLIHEEVKTGLKEYLKNLDIESVENKLR